LAAKWPLFCWMETPARGYNSLSFQLSEFLLLTVIVAR
jgi:hypothetical protein